MSKIQDQMRGLLGKYSGKKVVARSVTAKRSPSKPSREPASKTTSMVPKSSPTRPLPTSRSASRSSPGNRPRLPDGLMWADETIDGRDDGIISEMRNYIAFPNLAYKGFYYVVQLDPRKNVLHKVRLSEILPAMRRYNDAAINAAVHATDIERFGREKHEREVAAWNDQPGFYVVPGETEDVNGETVNAEGPWDDVQEAIDEAHQTMSSLTPNDPRSVLVIEAQNPRAAENKQGHVWWQDGAFRGPPTDPRQRTFNW